MEGFGSGGFLTSFVPPLGGCSILEFSMPPLVPICRGENSPRKHCAQLSISLHPKTQSIKPLPQSPFSELWSQCHSLCYAPLRPLPSPDPGKITVISFSHSLYTAS